jgi:hypothetical protein
MEQPFQPLLHRELHIHDVIENFDAQIALTKDIVNYGSNLIASCLNSSGRELGDVIAITVLFKQLVSMLDALEVLISNACVPASLLQARAILEASVQLDFLLDGDKEEKAKFFFISNIRKELHWTKTTQEGSPEHRNLFTSLGEFAAVLEGTRARMEEVGATQLSKIEVFLAKEPWKTINDRIVKLRGRNKFDKNWYASFGPTSFRSLCNELGRLHEYELFYSGSSEKMHGTEYKSHIDIEVGQISVSPIRNLATIDSVLNFSISSALHSYACLLEEYRPGQLREFSSRYARDWREPFLSTKEVAYKTGEGAPVEL